MEEDDMRCRVIHSSSSAAVTTARNQKSPFNLLQRRHSEVCPIMTPETSSRKTKRAAGRSKPGFNRCHSTCSSQQFGGVKGRGGPLGKLLEGESEILNEPLTCSVVRNGHIGKMRKRKLCRDNLQSGTKKSSGPCLSDRNTCSSVN